MRSAFEQQTTILVSSSTISTSTENTFEETKTSESITNFPHENKTSQSGNSLSLERDFRIKKVEEIRSNLFAQQRANTTGIDMNPTREYLYQTEKIKDVGVACVSSELKLASRESLYRTNKIKDTGMLTEELLLGTNNNSHKEIYSDSSDNDISENKSEEVSINKSRLHAESVNDVRKTLSPARTVTSGILYTNEGKVEMLDKKVGKSLITTGTSCDFSMNRTSMEKNSQLSYKSRLYDEGYIQEDSEGIISTTMPRRNSRLPLRRFTPTKSSSLKFDLTQSLKAKEENPDVNRNKCFRAGSEIIHSKSCLDKGSQIYQRYNNSVGSAYGSFIN